MRIIVFHRANDYTGSSRVIQNVIQSKFENDEVVVVTNNFKGRGFLSETPNLNMIPLWYPTISGKPVKGISFMMSQIHVLLVAIYFSVQKNEFYLNTITQYIPGLVGSLMRKKMTIHVHEKFVAKSIEHRVMEWTLRNVRAKRIFVSYWLRQQYDLNGKDDLVEYNTLSPSFLQQVNPRVSTSRVRNQILMLSSLTKAKGAFVLIQLAQRLPQYQFVWVVSASQQEVVAFFNGTVFSSNLSIVSSPSDIHPYYAEADLLLNLSDPNEWVETFGMTILEAMPYGIPAIVPNIGGPAELVIDGLNGYCVDVTDVKTVASAIQKAFSDQNYPQLVQNTFDRFSQIN